MTLGPIGSASSSLINDIEESLLFISRRVDQTAERGRYPASANIRFCRGYRALLPTGTAPVVAMSGRHNAASHPYGGST